MRATRRRQAAGRVLRVAGGRSSERSERRGRGCQPMSDWTGRTQRAVPARPRQPFGIAEARSRLDSVILVGPSARERERAVRKPLPMRSHFIGRANFDDRPVNSGPQERSSGPLLLLPDSSAGLRVRRPRRGRGQRSRRERRARSRALVSPARASVSASSAVHWGERDRERLTDRPLRAGRVGERLTGRRCESADALSVIALGVPAATQLAFFPSGVRHSGGV